VWPESLAAWQNICQKRKIMQKKGGEAKKSGGKARGRRNYVPT